MIILYLLFFRWGIMRARWFCSIYLRERKKTNSGRKEGGREGKWKNKLPKPGMFRAGNCMLALSNCIFFSQEAVANVSELPVCFEACPVSCCCTTMFYIFNYVWYAHMQESLHVLIVEVSMYKSPSVRKEKWLWSKKELRLKRTQGCIW